MIYLFEDRKGRMGKFFSINSASKLFIEANFNCPETIGLSEYISNNFSDAKAILFHSSYEIANKNITKENIRQEFINRKTPFILFSGGLQNNYFFTSGTVQANVNSGTMYRNLRLFIEEFENEENINVPLLLFGKKYLMNEILSVQRLVIAYLSNKSSDDFLSNNELMNIKRLIKPAMNDPQLNEAKENLIAYLSQKKCDITLSDIESEFQKISKNHL